MDFSMSTCYWPTDPRDPFYLTTCFVCQDQPKSGHVHIKHYGGVVCFSCRQFFRRAHQQSKSPNFVCNKDGQCPVTVKSRRKCQKCRYVRCRMAGMDPDAVLTVEQKKIRFQKFLRKKRKRSMNTMSLSLDDDDQRSDSSSTHELQNSQPDDDDNYFSDLARGSPQKIPRYEQPPPQLIQITRPIYYHEPVIEMVPRPVTPPPPPPPVEHWNPNLAIKVETILRSYLVSFGDLQATNVDSITSFPLETTLECFNILTTKNEIQSHLMDVAEHFQQFAQMQSQFFKMRTKNQQILLSRNTPIFIQLYNAYQLGKIFGFDIDTSNYFAVRRFFAKMRWFNHVTKLFESSSDLQYYTQLLLELHSQLRLHSAAVRAVLAYIILFHFSKDMLLQDVFVLDDITILNDIIFDNCLRSRDTGFHLGDMVAILECMVRFCKDSIVWNGHELMRYRTPCLPFLQNLPMRFTCEEKLWLKNKFCRLMEAVRSVSMNHEMIRKFLMISRDVLPATSFLQACSRMIHERTWKVLNIHEEFQCLTNSEQAKIFAEVRMLGFAFFIAKLENCTSAMMQFKEEFPEIGMDELKQKCISVFKMETKVKKMWCSMGFLQKWEKPQSKISLGKYKEHFQSIFSEADYVSYQSALAQLKPTLDDSFLRKMTLLMSLTSLGGDRATSGLASNYLNTLLRFLSSLPLKNFDSPPTIIKKIFSSVRALNSVAVVMNKVVTV